MRKKDINKKLESIAIDYTLMCKARKKIQEKIRNIYKKGEECINLGTSGDCEYINTISEDIGNLYNTHKKWCDEDYNAKDLEIIECYEEANCKNKEEVLDELLELFDKRKKLLKDKGKITRKLYLYGNSMLNIKK